MFWKIDESGITYGCSWTSPRSTGIEIQRHGNPFFVLSVELPHAVRELKFIDMHLLLSILWLNFPTQYGNWNVGDYIISADHHVELPHAVRELKWLIEFRTLSFNLVELPHAVRELKFTWSGEWHVIRMLNFPTQYGNWNLYIFMPGGYRCIVELPHAWTSFELMLSPSG